MNDPMALELEDGQVLEVGNGDAGKVCLTVSQWYESMRFSLSLDEAKHLAAALLSACDEGSQ